MIDLSFIQQNQQFNVRAAAIIRHEGFLLCDVDHHHGTVYLPGGRVKRGENSAQALTREMSEELGVKITPGRPKIITESFYKVGERAFHELTFYYYLDLPKGLDFTPNKVCQTFQDEGKKHELLWLRAVPETLLKADVKPQQLHQFMIEPPVQLQHLTVTA